MLDAQHLLVFVLASWLLNLTPGPDVLYIVTNALRGGARAGLVAMLGITAGCCVHVTAVALGLSSILSASTAAFAVVKWIGAGYLVWMGVRTLLKPIPKQAVDLEVVAARTPPVSLRQVFVGGFWTNALNPKVAIFFLAFIPQFINAGATNKGLAFLALGLLFNINSMPVNAGWALAAAWAARRPLVQRGMHWLDKAAGLMFVGFGVRLALYDEQAR